MNYREKLAVVIVLALLLALPSYSEAHFRTILSDAGVLVETTTDFHSHAYVSWDGNWGAYYVTAPRRTEFYYRVYYYDPWPISTVSVVLGYPWHSCSYWSHCYYRHPCYSYNYWPTYYHRHYHHSHHHRRHYTHYSPPPSSTRSSGTWGSSPSGSHPPYTNRYSCPPDQKPTYASSGRSSTSGAVVGTRMPAYRAPTTYRTSTPRYSTPVRTGGTYSRSAPTRSYSSSSSYSRSYSRPSSSRSYGSRGAPRSYGGGRSGRTSRY